MRTQSWGTAGGWPRTKPVVNPPNAQARGWLTRKQKAEERRLNTLEVLKRLAAQVDDIGVCHCGAPLKDHSQLDNHAPSLNPDPETKLLMDAKEAIEQLLYRSRP